MRTSRLALLSTIGMVLAAGAAYACTPAGGFGATGAPELAAFEPLEVDASWLRRGDDADEPLAALVTTAVPVAPAGTTLAAATPVPIAAPAPLPRKQAPRSKTPISKTSFATPPRPPKQEPLLSFARPAPPPAQTPPVQTFAPMPQMPQMPQAASIRTAAPTSTARPVSTSNSF